MKATNSLVLSIALCFHATTCLAQKSPVRGRITRGVSQESMRKLSAAAARYTRTQQRVELARMDRKLEQLDAASAKTRDKFESNLQKHSDFAAFNKQYLAISKSNSTKGPKRLTFDQATRLYSAKSTAIARLTRQYSPMLQQVLRNSRVDARPFVKLVTDFHESKDVTVNNPSFFIYLLTRNERNNPPPEPPQTAFQIEAPYCEEVGEDTHRTGGVTSVIAEANEQDGSLENSGDAAGAGQSHSFTYVGDYVTLPEGYYRIKVTARIRSDYGVFAGGVVGVGNAEINAHLRLTGIDGNTDEYTELIDSASFLGAGCGGEEHTAFHNVEHIFRVSAPGEAHLVQAGLWTFAGAAGGAYVSNEAESEVEWIALEVTAGNP